MKKLLILMVAFSALYSCSEDPAADVAPQSQNPQIILAPRAVSEASEIIAQVGQNTANLDFGFEFAAGTTYYGRDVEILFNNETYTIVAEQGTDNYVSVGNIDYTFNVPSPSGVIPYGGISTPVSVDLGDTDYSFRVEERPSDLVVLKGSGTPLTFNANLYERLPIPEAGKLNILIDWVGGEEDTKDVDLFLVSGDQDLYGDLLDSSASISRFEDVSFDEVNPDGIYSLYMYEWYFDYPVTYSIFVAESNGNISIFEGELTYDGFTFTFTKSTDVVTGDVSYTFNPL